MADPFCGRCTTPFQALLMDRNALGRDINPVAYCLTKQRRRVGVLPPCSVALQSSEVSTKSESGDQLAANAGLLSTWVQHVTLSQISICDLVLDWRTRRVDAMVAALALGALHGESEKSSSYLSAQMPRAISTKPAYSVRFWDKHSYCAPERDAFELLGRQAKYRYRSPLPQLRGRVELSDFRELHRSKLVGRQEAKCIITSPPYLDVTSFEEDQWLRLWFLGGPPHPTRNRVSRDDRTSCKHYWQMIADFGASPGIWSRVEVMWSYVCGEGNYRRTVSSTDGRLFGGRRRDVTLVARESSAIPPKANAPSGALRWCPIEVTPCFKFAER